MRVLLSALAALVLLLAPAAAADPVDLRALAQLARQGELVGPPIKRGRWNNVEGKGRDSALDAAIVDHRMAEEGMDNAEGGNDDVAEAVIGNSDDVAKAVIGDGDDVAEAVIGEGGAGTRADESAGVDDGDRALDRGADRGGRVPSLGTDRERGAREGAVDGADPASRRGATFQKLTEAGILREARDLGEGGAREAARIDKEDAARATTRERDRRRANAAFAENRPAARGASVPGASRIARGVGAAGLGAGGPPPALARPPGSASLALVMLSTALMAGASALGAVPFFFVERLSKTSAGAAAGAAAGVMISVSFDLVHEGEEHGPCGVVIGCALGAAFVAWASRALARYEGVRFGDLRGSAASRALLFVGIMGAHALGEGAGVGVSFAGPAGGRRGGLTAIAIAVHNVPEGLATASVLTRQGLPPRSAALWAFLTALPQPLLALPAYLAVDSFGPALPLALGFAAGSMVWMAFAELLPDALRDAEARVVAGTATVAAFSLEALRIATSRTAAGGALVAELPTQSGTDGLSTDALGDLTGTGDAAALALALPPLISRSALLLALLPAVALAPLAGVAVRRLLASAPAAAAGAGAALAAALAAEGALRQLAERPRVPALHTAAAFTAGAASSWLVRSKVLSGVSSRRASGELPTSQRRTSSGGGGVGFGNGGIAPALPSSPSKGGKGLDGRLAAPARAAASAAAFSLVLAAVPTAWAAARGLLLLGDEGAPSAAAPLLLTAAVACALAGAAAALAELPAGAAALAAAAAAAAPSFLAYVAARGFRTAHRDLRLALSLWRYPLGAEDSLAAAAAGALAAAALALFAVGSAASPSRARGGAVLGAALAAASSGTSAALCIVAGWCSGAG